MGAVRHGLLPGTREGLLASLRLELIPVSARWNSRPQAAVSLMESTLAKNDTKRELGIEENEEQQGRTSYFLWNSSPGRAIDKNSIGNNVRPLVTRSARISPMTEQNLKPCPEKPAANATFFQRGC